MISYVLAGWLGLISVELSNDQFRDLNHGIRDEANNKAHANEQATAQRNIGFVVVFRSNGEKRKNPFEEMLEEILERHQPVEAGQDQIGNQAGDTQEHQIKQPKRHGNEPGLKWSQPHRARYFAMFCPDTIAAGSALWCQSNPALARLFRFSSEQSVGSRSGTTSGRNSSQSTTPTAEPTVPEATGE